MKIECFLCSKVIPVQTSKKGLPWFYCEDCQFRGFVNSEQGIAGLETQAVDGGRFEPRPQVEPSEPPTEAHRLASGVDAKQVSEAIKGEIMPLLKTMQEEIRGLKAQTAEAKAPAKRKTKPTPRKPVTIREYIEANA